VIRRPGSLPEWRLAAFALALLGSCLSLACAIAGETTLAVAVGLRVLGTGLVGMGVATVRIGDRGPAVGTTAVPGLRGVVLLALGVVLLAVPGSVATLAGP
jgi:hypothetical protein